MPQLDVSTYPSQIFWLLICFGILCFAIAGFLAPRFGRAVESREMKLQQQQEQAAAFLQEATAIQADNQMRLVNLRQDLSQQQRQFMEEIHQNKATQLQEFDHQLAQKIHHVREKLTADKDVILDNLSELLYQLTMLSSPKIFGSGFNEEPIRAAIEKVVGEK